MKTPRLSEPSDIGSSTVIRAELHVLGVKGVERDVEVVVTAEMQINKSHAQGILRAIYPNHNVHKITTEVL